MANLTQAWTAASAALPLEWRLKGVVEGPREAAPVIRSGSWLAWAVGPNGDRAEGIGDNPIQALLDLTAKLEPIRGNRNG